ncbi:hypothetical protein [Aliikangiella sp. IMCC44359]|uniref:hypothetical protein n=1 Tax=Aliikangiella sp. IMCC44359 TaxID=3459125 RepID=UPI00403AED91
MSDAVISWLLVVEFALPFALLNVVFLLIIMKNRKMAKESARKLILKIKNNEEHEKSNVIDFLTQKAGYEEDKAKSLAKKLINERKFLFRNIISGLLDKNEEAIVTLERDMARVTERYHALEFNANAQEEVAVEETSNQEDLDKIDELKQEVKGLKHEVHVTLTTLNNIFAEFSSMFGEEVPETEMSVDQIITAMESFSDKSVSSVPESDTEQEESESFDEGDELDAFSEELEESDEVPETVEDEDTDTDTEEELNFSIDDELDDIDSALDGLELGQLGDDDEIESDSESEPSWDEAFEESGDKKGD